MNQIAEIEVRLSLIGQVGGADVELVPVREASKRLGYAPRTIRKYAESGKLIGIKKFNMWFVYPQLIKTIPQTERQAPP